MLVHRVWMRLGPDSNHLFSCLFIALQSQGKKGSRSCQPILFLIFLVLQYQNEAKGAEEMFWCWAKVLHVKHSPHGWFVHKSITGWWRWALPVPSVQGCCWVPCLPQHPATATAHPCAQPGDKGTGYPRGHPSLGPAESPPWGHSSWWPGTGHCLEMRCSTSTVLFSSHCHCCLEGTARESSA